MKKCSGLLKHDPFGQHQECTIFSLAHAHKPKQNTFQVLYLNVHPLRVGRNRTAIHPAVYNS